MEIRRIGMSAIGVPANNIYHCIDRMKDPSQFSHREGIEDKHSRQLWRVFLGGCCLIFPASGRTPNIVGQRRKCVSISIHDDHSFCRRLIFLSLRLERTRVSLVDRLGSEQKSIRHGFLFY